MSDSGQEDSDGGYLTPQKAYELNVEQGMTQGEIAEEWGLSTTTVSKRKRQYEEMMDDVAATASRVASNTVSDAVSDDEPEDNPYDMVTAPCCGDDIRTPDNPGTHSCPSCGTDLTWSEDEL